MRNLSDGKGTSAKRKRHIIETIKGKGKVSSFTAGGGGESGGKNEKGVPPYMGPGQRRKQGKDDGAELAEKALFYSTGRKSY